MTYSSRFSESCFAVKHEWLEISANRLDQLYPSDEGRVQVVGDLLFNVYHPRCIRRNKPGRYAARNFNRGSVELLDASGGQLRRFPRCNDEIQRGTLGPEQNCQANHMMWQR
jgi:hypothetical protein